MKKALLVVHRYKSEDDDEWGSVAKDYGTSDLVENISKMHPSHDWRPATLAEARELMHKVKIDRLILVPMLKDYIEELNAYPDVQVDCLTADEYGKISKPPFAFLRKDYLN
ncbi:hypothetical protein P7E02_05840 [Enterococcus hulanensis]|uniref:hypothetical protein n=1 Tax=Enterococcus hulanensis TaxID=2559929 RepID=UPI00289081EC|nr:hypothetical protein [Enterococcus hulanensis]MDT2659379.1 hypothetical protein [Enterococcus hulanensis]